MNPEQPQPMQPTQITPMQAAQPPIMAASPPPPTAFNSKLGLISAIVGTIAIVASYGLSFLMLTSASWVGGAIGGVLGIAGLFLGIKSYKTTPYPNVLGLIGVVLSLFGLVTMLSILIILLSSSLAQPSFE